MSGTTKKGVGAADSAPGGGVLYALRAQNAALIEGLPEEHAKAVYAWLCSFRDDIPAETIRGAWRDLRRSEMCAREEAA